MRIYVNVGIEFRANGVTSSHFTIDFNWMTESGIIAGGNNKAVAVPFGTLTPDALNQAIINVVVASINASGQYTVAHGDKIMLIGGFTTITTH